MFFYLISLTVCVTVVAARESRCPQELNRGRVCNRNSTIRWYFDNVDKKCFPFKFHGCAGNSNNYDSHHSCSRRCDPEYQLMDSNPCLGGPATGSCDNPGQPPYPPGSKPLKCPKGSFCQVGYMSGLCCSEKLRDQALKEAAANKAVCPKGQKVVQKVEGFKDSTEAIRGKKCEHDFCPKGSTCFQKQTAFCCQ